MPFTYELFVAAARRAAGRPDADAAVRALLEATLQNPVAVPARDDDEVCLYQDATVSVWSCRFHPGVTMPPHEHKMRVWIGVYAGVEKSLLYRRDDCGLTPVGEHLIHCGQVKSLDADVVHAVTAEGSGPSEALHVYLGPLTDIERNLFDWDTGDPVPFTMENFDAMKRTH